MKKQLLFLLLMFVGIGSIWAQTSAKPSIRLRTTKKGNLNIYVTPAQDQTITIDWGNGTEESVAPNWSGKYTFSGTAKGEVITLYGLAKEVDLNGGYKDPNELSALELTGQTELQKLEARDGTITEVNLDGLHKLNYLDLSKNQIAQLNISSLSQLEYFIATDNKLATLTIGQHDKLRELKVSGNQLARLELPSILPTLRTLEVEGNALVQIEITKCPDLRQLNVNRNGFATLEVNKLTKLEKLYAQGNYLSKIDLSQNTELLGLDLSQNLLTTLDISHNTNLTGVEVASNSLKRIDVTHQPRLKTLNINKNENISHLNLSRNQHLRTLKADTTALSGLDLSACLGIDQIHLRGTRLTPCAFTYLFSTLPALERTTGYLNLLLSYTSWRGADFSILTEKRWKHDIDPDADYGTTIPCPKVSLSLEANTGGKASIEIISNQAAEIPSQVTVGTPVNIYTEVEEGYELESVMLETLTDEGKTIAYPISSEGTTILGDSKIIVRFAKQEHSELSLNTSLKQGADLSLTLRLKEDSSKDFVQIDWGNGSWEEVQVTRNQTTATVISGRALGSTIRIRGAINKLSAPESSLTSINFGESPELVELDLYGNELETIDLSALSKLEIVNLALNDLEAIDLSQCKALRSLTLYGNSRISTIDLSHNKQLVEADLKNLALASLSLDHPLLEELNVQGNKLSQIDLSKSPALVNLRLSYNQLSEFAPKAPLSMLKLLVITDNPLTQLDLSNAREVERIYMSNTQCKALSFPTGLPLNYLDISDCGLDACQLDNIYKALPQWSASSIGITEPTTLYNRGQSNRANQAATSQTSIATNKGWSVASQGDGTGCDDKGVDSPSRGHGYNYWHNAGTLSILLTDQLKDTAVHLYHISGKQIFRGEHQSEYHLTLTPGSYILRIAGNSHKLIVD